MTSNPGVPLSEGDAADFKERCPTKAGASIPSDFDVKGNVVRPTVTPTRQSQPPQTNIKTLSEDIYNVLDATQTHYADTTLAAGYALRIGGEFAKASVKRDRPREKGKLWASDIGKQCLRQHWYNFNEPQYGEKLNGQTKFKFL